MVFTISVTRVRFTIIFPTKSTSSMKLESTLFLLLICFTQVCYCIVLLLLLLLNHFDLRIVLITLWLFYPQHAYYPSATHVGIQNKQESHKKKNKNKKNKYTFLCEFSNSSSLILCTSSLFFLK